MAEAFSTNVRTRLERGIINFPGVTPESKLLVEKLLDADREKYHGMYGPGFHNHLSHQLSQWARCSTWITCWPLILQSVSSLRLWRICETVTNCLWCRSQGFESDRLWQKDSGHRKTNCRDYEGELDRIHWTGKVRSLHRYTSRKYSLYIPTRYYASYLPFFMSEIDEHGQGKTLETFVFDPAANGNGSDMLLRFIAGAWVRFNGCCQTTSPEHRLSFHPMIQTGVRLPSYHQLRRVLIYSISTA